MFKYLFGFAVVSALSVGCSVSPDTDTDGHTAISSLSNGRCESLDERQCQSDSKCEPEYGSSCPVCADWSFKRCVSKHDECSTNADCGSDKVCRPGVCLMFCQPSDPHCCAPNKCQDKPRGDDNSDECRSNIDCPGGFVCLSVEPGKPTACLPI